MRHEVKFVANEQEFCEFKNWMAFQSLGITKAFPSRKINNIYYDSWEFDCLKDNLSGVGDRYKSRLRWYGDYKNYSHSTFENKVKKSIVGYKNTCPLGYLALENMNFLALRKKLNEILPVSFQKGVSYLHNPVIVNQYSRDYYTLYGDKIRLTLDSKLQFSGISNQYQKILKRKEHHFPFYILEFKSDQSSYDLLSRAIAHLPLRKTRLSKYLLAASELFDVPYF